jgi:murein DD-endopeptidase MepM/ murein hydrolase activator NlpD
MKLKFKKIIFFFLTLIFISSLNASPSKLFVDPDSIIKSKLWVSKQYLPYEESNFISDSLRKNDPIFKNDWNNEVLFIYASYKYKDLPDSINISLVEKNQDFYFNWYGHLYWGYGPRWGKIHRGLDIYLETGDTIVSSFDGIVRYARFNNGGYGNCVIVRHLNGLETLYGHMSEIAVKENQFVKAGNLIGLGGSTGKSDGPHLHFETRYKDFSFDPYSYIDKTSNKLISNLLVLKKSGLTSYRYPSETPIVKSKTKSKKKKRKNSSKKKGKKTKKKARK